MAIVSGYQKMKDYIKQSSGYKLLSRWANANTLECDDGKTLQSKVGGISGISSSLTANSTTQAASTNLTNQLYQNISRRCNRFADHSGSSLADAIDLVFDAVTAEIYEGFFSWLVRTNQGYFALYGYLSVNMTGIATKIGDAEAYAFYKSSGGADAVLKKLGSSAPSERLIRSNLSATTTINMADYCGDISKVTINDFLFTITNINAYCTSWGHPSDTHGPATSNNFQPVSGSYNAETGILTVTISVPTYSSGTYGQTGGGSCRITPRVNVYFFG